MRTGRPMSIRMNIAPKIRAMAVMNSATLVIGLLQVAFAALTTADTTVPAMLTPVKKMNTEMYKPHEIRSLMFVTTRPSRSWIEYANMPAARTAARNNSHTQYHPDVLSVGLVVLAISRSRHCAIDSMW